jgi:hypothetical protein
MQCCLSQGLCSGSKHPWLSVMGGSRLCLSSTAGVHDCRRRHAWSTDRSKQYVAINAAMSIIRTAQPVNATQQKKVVSDSVASRSASPPQTKWISSSFTTREGYQALEEQTKHHKPRRKKRVRHIRRSKTPCPAFPPSRYYAYRPWYW